MNPEQFAAKAACASAGEDRDLFFGPEPEGLTQGQHQSQIKADALVAKVRYCDECPVRAECLELGLDEEYGVWGGLDPEQRQRLARGLAPRGRTKDPLVSPRRDDIVTRIKSGDSVDQVAADLEILSDTVVWNLHAHLGVRMRQRIPISDMRDVA